MALPLPRVVADVGPGGGIPTAMNAFNQYALNRVKAQYAPLITQADAASKLAYANLMGPQFLAKLLGNPDVLANTPDAQQKVNYLLGAGMGQGTGNAILGNNPNNIFNRPPGLLERAVTGIKNAFGFGQQPSNQNSNPSANPINNSPVQNNNVAPTQNEPGTNVSPQGASPKELSDAAQAWMNSDEAHGQEKSQGYATLPGTNDLLNWYRNQQQQNNQSNNQGFYENAAQAEKIKAQGKTEGENIGKAVNELDTQYQQDTEAMVPLQRLVQITQSPIFMNMRNQIPGFQNLQLKALSKVGTPEQQRAIGDFIVSAKQAMANAVNGFKGRAMAKEFDFANQMKVSENDTIDTMLGKLESLITFKQAAMQRDRIASQLMDQKHLNRGDAYERANKQVNIDEIRNQVSSQLKSPVKIKNKTTGEVRWVSPKEYNDLLNQK